MSKQAANNTKKTKTTATTVEFDLSKFASKSAAIRHLAAEGKSRSEIAKLLNIRYQHVRNVLETPLKRKDK